MSAIGSLETVDAAKALSEDWMKISILGLCMVMPLVVSRWVIPAFDHRNNLAALITNIGLSTIISFASFCFVFNIIVFNALFAQTSADEELFWPLVLDGATDVFTVESYSLLLSLLLIVPFAWLGAKGASRSRSVQPCQRHEEQEQ